MRRANAGPHRCRRQRGRERVHHFAETAKRRDEAAGGGPLGAAPCLRATRGSRCRIAAPSRGTAETAPSSTTAPRHRRESRPAAGRRDTPPPSRPKRRPMNEAIDSSPAAGRPGNTHSAAIRSFRAAKRRARSQTATSRPGMPNTDASGRARSVPPRTRKVPRCNCGRGRSRHADLPAEFDRRRFVCEKRVGARVDDESVDALGLDHAAERRRRLEQEEWHVSPCELVPAARPLMPRRRSRRRAGHGVRLSAREKTQTCGRGWFRVWVNPASEFLVSDLCKRCARTLRPSTARRNIGRGR